MFYLFSQADNLLTLAAFISDVVILILLILTMFNSAAQPYFTK